MVNRIQRRSLSISTYLNKVHLREVLIIARLLNIEDRNDIFMVEVAEQFHLTQSSEAKH